VASKVAMMDLGWIMNCFRVFLIGGLAVLSTAAELPVKEVVLYKNGVGYFERSGPLRPRVLVTGRPRHPASCATTAPIGPLALGKSTMSNSQRAQ